jgi:LysR family transcriptional regulator, low CO2-responsive transcriptional regulator
MSLTLSRLRTVKTVAEAGSYAAAARQLGVSQPTVSQQIRDLEAGYGVRLFTRERGALVPTPLCHELSEVAERISIEGDEAERLLTRHSSLEHGRLSVGLGNTMPGMAVVAAFHKRHPRVTLKIESGSHDQIVRAVLTRSVDVGILPDVAEDGRFAQAVLVENEVVAIAPLAPPFPSGGPMRSADLIGYPLIFRSRGSSTQRVVDRSFHRAGLKPRPFLTLDTRDGVYEAVVNGLGIGFMWRYCTGRQDGVARIRLSDCPATHREVVFSLAAERSHLVAEFMTIAEAECERFRAADWQMA